MATLKKATKKSSKKVTPMFSQKDIEKFGAEYDEVSKQIKLLDAKKKDLANKIKQGAEDFGVKDDKGSFYIDGDIYILGKVAKKSMSIDQSKGVELLKELGLDECIKTIPAKEVVNEEAIEKAVANGDLSLDDVEEFTEVKTSYSVSVKEKEEVTAEVEQSTLKSVAKRK